MISNQNWPIVSFIWARKKVPIARISPIYRISARAPNLVGAPNRPLHRTTHKQPRLWLNAKCSSEFWPLFSSILSRLSALNWFSILVRLPRNFFLFDCANEKTNRKITLLLLPVKIIVTYSSLTIKGWLVSQSMPFKELYSLTVNNAYTLLPSTRNSQTRFFFD